MRRVSWWWPRARVIGALALFVAGCSRSELSTFAECAPGDAEFCDDRGRLGGRVCQPSGLWGPCSAGDGSGGSSSQGGSGGFNAGGSAGFGGLGGSSGFGAFGGSAGQAGSGGQSGCEHDFYLLGSDTLLWHFDPTSLAVDDPRGLGCSGLQSMAMTSDGELYISSFSGALFTVDPSTGACTLTGFNPPGWAGTPYALGTGPDPDGAGETIYLARELQAPAGIELYSYAEDSQTASLLTVIDPAFDGLEVAGSVDGRLFGMHMALGMLPARLVEFSTADYSIVHEVELPISPNWSGFDFAYFLGDFYLFAAEDGAFSSRVFRYTVQTDQLSEIGSIPIVVIGAGARACPG